MREREGGEGNVAVGYPARARQTAIFDGGAAVSKLFAQIHRHSPDEQARGGGSEGAARCHAGHVTCGVGECA